MVDNPRNFILIILAFVISVSLIVSITKSYLRDSESNSGTIIESTESKRNIDLNPRIVQ